MRSTSQAQLAAGSALRIPIIASLQVHRGPRDPLAQEPAGYHLARARDRDDEHDGRCGHRSFRQLRAPEHFYVTGREDGWIADSHAASAHAAALPPRTVRYPQIAAYRSEGPKASLVVVQRGADFRTKAAPLGGWVEGAVLDYVLEQRKRQPQHLADVAWANWDEKGRLLVATHDGVLQIRRVLGRGGTEVCWSHDANADRYEDGLGAPAWAKRW